MIHRSNQLFRQACSFCLFFMFIFGITPVSSVRPSRASCPADGAPWEQIRWLQDRGEFFIATSLALQEIYEKKNPQRQVASIGCLTDIYIRAGQLKKASDAWIELSRYVKIEDQAKWHIGDYMLMLSRKDIGTSAIQRILIENTYKIDDLHWSWLRGIKSIRMHDWEEATAHFIEMNDMCAKGAADRTTCIIPKKMILALSTPPEKHSALISLTLSAIIPGSGLLYANHRFDALVYGGLTMTSAWLTWNTHDRDSGLLDQRLGTYLLATTSLIFYIANLVSSYDVVKRTNETHAWNYELGLLPRSMPSLPTFH